jgi:ABC-type antimicrobial peptide transport system permease subunit
MFLVVKPRVAPESIVSRLRGELNALDPHLALANIETMDARLRESAAGRRFQSALMGLFAALAVVLAMMGVFAVLSCVVAARRREIGVRMALGSSRAGVFRLVLRQGLKPVVAGVAVGWVLAFLLRGVLAGLLFGVSPHDPRTFILVGIAFTFLATLACLLPARRAACIAPVQALRSE